MKNLKENIRILLKPSYWFIKCRYSKNWDKVLNYLLDNYDFEIQTDEMSKLGGVCIWICNHPNRSFKPYHRNIRASRKTIYRANEKYEKSLFNKLLEEKDKKTCKLNK